MNMKTRTMMWINTDEEESEDEKETNHKEWRW